MGTEAATKPGRRGLHPGGTRGLENPHPGWADVPTETHDRRNKGPEAEKESRLRVCGGVPEPCLTLICEAAHLASRTIGFPGSWQR